jgi:hypothetical protein
VSDQYDRARPKLTPHQKREAIKRRNQGETLADIARSYNVSPATIFQTKYVRCPEVENTPPPSPVSIDVGLKASLEVKAEIPKEDTGRLVAALTDIIRPFTERRGLRADQIRLQREDVLVSIAKKARERAELEKIELHPVPTKMLVPFLEKASLEDADKEMQDRWAALLLSASKEYQATHLTFIDILSRMSSNELKLLEEGCFSYEAFPERSYPNGHYERNYEILEGYANLLVVEDSQPEPTVENSVLHFHMDAGAAKEAYEKLVNAANLSYGQIMHVGVCYRPSGGASWFYKESSGTPRFRSLEILERERLVNIERIKFSNKSEIGYFNVTYLGIQFVLACSPEASKMVAKMVERMPKPRP